MGTEGKGEGEGELGGVGEGQVGVLAHDAAADAIGYGGAGSAEEGSGKDIGGIVDSDIHTAICHCRRPKEGGQHDIPSGIHQGEGSRRGETERGMPRREGGVGKSLQTDEVVGIGVVGAWTRDDVFERHGDTSGEQPRAAQFGGIIESRPVAGRPPIESMGDGWQRGSKKAVAHCQPSFVGRPGTPLLDKVEGFEVMVAGERDGIGIGRLGERQNQEYYRQVFSHNVKETSICKGNIS